MAAETEMTTDVVPVYASPLPAIRKIEIDRPWQWLVKGWQDMRKVAGRQPHLRRAGRDHRLRTDAWADLGRHALSGAAAGGGIPDRRSDHEPVRVSRRAEPARAPSWPRRWSAFRRNGSQIGLMGVALMLLMFAWARIAAIIFFLYFGLEPPSFENLIASTFLQPDTLPFLVFGTAGR